MKTSFLFSLFSHFLFQLLFTKHWTLNLHFKFSSFHNETKQKESFSIFIDSFSMYNFTLLSVCFFIGFHNVMKYNYHKKDNVDYSVAILLCNEDERKELNLLLWTYFSLLLVASSSFETSFI